MLLLVVISIVPVLPGAHAKIAALFLVLLTVQPPEQWQITCCTA